MIGRLAIIFNYNQRKKGMVGGTCVLWAVLVAVVCCDEDCMNPLMIEAETYTCRYEVQY